MEVSSLVSHEGMRIGYLYDNMDEDDKLTVENIADKYNGIFPLLYSGLGVEMVTDVLKARVMYDIVDKK